MEEITGFSMKDSLSAPGLAWRYFNSLRTVEDELNHIFNGKSMRQFIRQSIKRGRVSVFSHYYKSENCSDVLSILLRELNVGGNVYDFIEVYMKYKNDRSKVIKAEYESNFNDYRKVNEDEMNEYINKKLGELPILKFFTKVELR